MKKSMSMKTWMTMGAALWLGGCAAGQLDIQRDELSDARHAIEAARKAGAERCAPKEMARAQSELYYAAHELTENGVHPDETAGHIADARKYADKARVLARKRCAPKPKAKPEIIRLEGVHFRTNSAELTPASTATLDRAVAALKKRPDIRVEVAAHTDSRGSAAYNLKLSERRAKSVMEYLISHGVDASRLTSRGYGESQPVASNATPEGRAMNRRVELRVIR